MTSVHGIAVAGGTFPAQIWHDYMLTAAKGDCVGFPKPTTPIHYQSFTGRYVASSGGGGYSRQSQPTTTTYGPTPNTPAPQGGSPAPGAVVTPQTPKLIIPRPNYVPPVRTPPSTTGLPGGVAAPAH
jgi:penicillin-binding protein 1A